MRWIIPDENITCFIKSLRQMAKIGTELHIEVQNNKHLCLQTVSSSRAVYFSITFKDDFFVDIFDCTLDGTIPSSADDSSQGKYNYLSCKVPFRFVSKCLTANLGKHAAKIDLKLTSDSLTFEIFGNDGWNREYVLYVSESENIQTSFDSSSTNAVFHCQIGSLAENVETFPTGTTEISMWSDGDRLHMKSYQSKSSSRAVRSEVSVPIEEFDFFENTTLTEPITFSLKEVVAILKLWDQISKNENDQIQAFCEEKGRPLIMHFEENRFKSVIVAATLNLNASYQNIGNISDHSIINRTNFNMIPADRDNSQPVFKPKKKRNLSESTISSPQRQPAKKNQLEKNIEKTSNYLLFGESSCSEDETDESFLGNKFGRDGTRLLEDSKDHSQPKRLAQILVYDSD